MERPWTDPNTPLTAIASYELLYLSPEDTLLTAVRLIGRNRLSSIVVLDHTRHPVGILTERTLLEVLHADLAPQTPLNKVMDQPVIVSGTMSCNEAYQICLREDVRHLILVDEDKRAIALVSQTDFHRHLPLDTPTGQTRVGSIMRRSFCVLGPDTPLNSALEQMYDRFAGGIIVVEQQRPVGILSERDLARLYLATSAQRLCPIAEVMTCPVRTIPVDTTLAEAAKGMLNHRIRQYPVVDGDGLLLGLIFSQDLIQAMAFGLADSALVEETNTNQNLLEQAPFPLFITGIDDGLIYFLNARAERQFEFERQEMLGKPVEQFYCNLEDRKRLLHALHHDGKTFDVPIKLTNTKGKIFLAQVSCTLIRYQHRAAILTAINDITEQQQATEHLQHERTKLHALLQSVPDLLWVKDPDGHYLVCNPVFERFFGTAQAEIVGKTDYDFVSREQADFFRANDQKAIAANQPRINEEWLEFADGSRQGLFEAIKTPLRDESGNLIGILCIARDITDRRREQRDLRERIKEQQCLYRIFALTEDIHAPFGEQLQQVVELIPHGWQYPEITAAKIDYAQTPYLTPNFQESSWMLKTEATTRQGELLQLTLSYQEERSREDEGPFLREEQELAEAIIHRLAEVVERRHTLDVIKVRDELIASMFAQTTDAIILFDTQSHRFIDFNTIAHTSLGYTYDEFAQLTVEDIQKDLSPDQILLEQQRVLQGEPISIETKHRHKNGTFRDVTLTLHSLSLQGKQLISAVWQDITERKARQRELEDNQKRLKAITDSALDAILMMDSQGNLSYWNPAAEQMLGYRADEVLGQSLHQLLAPPRFHSDHNRAFDHFLQTGRGQAIGKTLELSALRKDGEEIIISLSLSSVNLNDEWHAVGILRDISERKQHQAALESALVEAEAANNAKTEVLAHLEELVQARTAELDAVNEQLRCSEERYALALDATSDGLWDWDLHTGELYCSPAYYRMLGYTPGELTPNQYASGLDLIHPEDREWVSTSLQQQLRRKDVLEMEFRMIGKNGNPVWILSRGKVVSRTPDGQPHRAVGIHTDLTSRKQIELELRRISDEQETIFNAVASGIGFIRDRKVVRCNRKLEEIFGFSPGEMVGTMTNSWYRSDADFAEFGPKVAHDLQTTGRFYIERQLRRRDGSLFWARMNARAWDPTDISKGLVGLLDDITEERKAAEALRSAKEEAEAATRAKSEFLANMSHEIRTPMNAIIGFAHLIKQEPLSPQQLHQLEKLADASHHLLNIINDILDLSKIEANKMPLVVDDFEPRRVVDQVCSLLSDKAHAKNIALRVDTQHIPQVLRGDGPRLGQILLNLVGNAVKFTEKGRIDITASTSQEEPDKVILRFTVTDTGIGMDKDLVTRVFKAFEQADSSTTRRFGGTGLGLAISKQLVELMGG
ncbi:MAG: PAS domain S-box protein, partial [Desulfobulbus sp.]|nr:PAS domain S-box protein [Desulfobulbus sp.]